MDISNELIDVIKKSKDVVVLTGAGVSAESGISTFRDPEGLWTKFNPMELASMDGFMSNPDLVWEWYNYRRKIVNEVEPNPGHIAIAQMEKIFPKFTLITQNVDRLHQRAGSKKPIELHGNILDNYCKDCKTPFEGDPLAELHVPKCKECDGMIRPAVVWFGEMLPMDELFKAEQSAMKADLFFSIGTSAEVYPAARLPLTAKEYGAIVIEINPNRTSITNYMDYFLPYPSGEILPLILNKITN